MPIEHRWKTAVIVLGVLGLSSGFARSLGAPSIWYGHILDIAGPAWHYILLRQLFLPEERRWPFVIRYITPTAAAVPLVGICYLIEIAQFFGLYESVFDPWDFVAYTSGVLVCFLVDSRIERRNALEEGEDAAEKPWLQTASQVPDPLAADPETELQEGFGSRRARRVISLWEIGLVVVVVAVIQVARIAETPFHADESGLIATSDMLRPLLGLRARDAVWSLRYETLAVQPVPRYLIAAGWTLGGYSPEELNRPWNLSLDEDDNLAEGRMPSPRLLWWSRLPMAVLSAMTAGMLAWVVSVIAGRATAVLLLGMFVFNPYLRVMFLRAMAEASLVFAFALSAVALVMTAKKWIPSESVAAWPLGKVRELLVLAVVGAVAAGFSGNAKLNGIAVVAAPAAWWISTAFRGPRTGTVLYRILGGVVPAAIMVAVSLFFFVAINPTLYPDPVGRTTEMVRHRMTEMGKQVRRSPELEMRTFRERSVVISERVFSTCAALRFPGAAVLNILLCAVGAFVSIKRSVSWCCGGRRGGPDLALLLVSATAVGPILLVFLDWNRYYVLPVVFGSVYIALGAGWMIDRIVVALRKNQQVSRKRSEEERGLSEHRGNFRVTRCSNKGMMLIGTAHWAIVLATVLVLPACSSPPADEKTILPRSGEPAGFVEALTEAALERTTHRVVYDGSYRRIAFPNGDVPDRIGVCTDVVIRAYRQLGIDLQAEVHDDMASNFDVYPNRWSLTRPDPNIDHRRVPNLEVFFVRHGDALPITEEAMDYLPGDLVTWSVGALPHIGIMVDRRSSDGRRFMVVHNIGRGPELEDMLFDYPITGHFRYYGGFFG